MTTPQDRTVLWVAAAVIFALLCCLCLVLTATAASVWFAVDSSERLPPSTGSTPGPTPDVPESSWEFRPASPQARAMLERLSTSIVPISDPISLAERLSGETGIPKVLAESAAPIPLGTVQTFWASNVDTVENFQVEAELVYATPHVYFWVEQGVRYDFDELQALVDEFEEVSYPTVRAFFGSEWSPGVDGDPHLYMLLANGLGNSIAGYYSSSDQYSPLAHEYSNGHEMFYLMASNIDLGSDFTAGVLAHEFQHMVHWYLDRNEETWMNEGFSELAAHLSGFDVGGMDFEFALDPDQTLTQWPSGPGQAGGHYGQAFLLLTYFLDRFGAEATQALVANPANGFDSIDQTLTDLGIVDETGGEPLEADHVFLDWALALLLQDATVGDGRFAYTSYHLAPQPAYAETVGECPVSDQRRSVSQYGVDYLRITCPGRHRLAVEGTSLVPILPVGPHSGDFAFWSNRGDESDMTLSRAFDLTSVSGPAALEYWVWYDLEADYDYAYLEVSDDGGETWTILQTPSGTPDDPSGNSYGWAYNGFSGGGTTGTWIEERVDLSAYAGEQILIRFEYVTDAAVNGEGLLLDDVRLEAVGYREDFEGGDGGWQAEGFVRFYNALPQTYRLALVERGDSTRVTYLELDDSGRAEVTVEIGGDFDEAILVLTGTARHTWQPALYRFHITPE
jgi:hypothetical protein